MLDAPKGPQTRVPERRGDPFWRFARGMLRYRWLVGLALVFAVLSAGGLGAGILGLKPVLDNILGDEPRGLPEMAVEINTRLAKGGWGVQIPAEVVDGLPTKPFDAVLWIVIGLGALTVVGAACNFLHAYLSLTVISRTIANLRREAFHRAVHLPLKTVVGAGGLGGPSDLVSRIVYDTAQLGAGFNALLSRAVAQLSKGIAAFATALVLDWRLTVITIPVALLVGAVIRKLGKRIRRASRRALAGQSGLYQSASEVLSGLRVVKVHGSERFEAGRFHRINKEVVSQEFKVRTARALASPLVETISIFVLGGLALVAVKAILDGHLDKVTSLSTLAALGLAAAQLKPLTGLVNDIQQASAAAGRLDHLLGQEEERGHDASLPRMPAPAREIAFEGVSLTYAGADRPAVDSVSLRIAHGSTVAFVGPNGCGKTSLLSLIPRLLDPDAGPRGEGGRVLVDGADVRGFNVRSLRKHIGVVTQDTVLFKGSVAFNIAYGAEGATPERIRDAARRARAEEFILAKPGGYEYLIGEQGAGLSGGQKQRLAIARAILREPSILILDEATSMIDAESEARIAEAIAEFVAAGKGRRTCLIVAHRLSTVVSADRIVVMDRGRIVDQGTHRELLERDAIYQALVRNQMGGCGGWRGTRESQAGRPPHPVPPETVKTKRQNPPPTPSLWEGALEAVHGGLQAGGGVDHDGGGVVDLVGGCLAREAEAEGAVGGFGGDVHGAEDGGGFEGAGGAGGAGGGAQAALGEEQEQGLGFQSREADVGGVPEAAGAGGLAGGFVRSVDDGAGHAGEDGRLEAVAQGRQAGALGGVGEPVEGEAGGDAGADDAGDVLGSAATAELLLAEDLGANGDAGAGVEHADALGAVELVGGEGQQIRERVGG
jgi:ABC-type multidrug transport system fused ATPase/permease subunit